MCTVDIIFRPESKGASPQRGSSAFSAGLARPVFAAQETSAASVGSPVTVPSAFCSASLHSAMADAMRVSSSPKKSTTVILFWVRVPVLSEQMIWAQPRVSTAVRRRMMAFRFDMLVTPMERTTVTTAARPSGMAATARETAIMKESRARARSKRPARMIWTAKTTTQIASTIQVRMRESWLSFLCKGVWPSWACSSASAILPISVCMPVAVTTARPRPYTTVPPM